jgi:DNA adenine methylase
LKWIGNKQRFAQEIISFFPDKFGIYHEPFLGSGAVLGVLAPKIAEASDSFLPLVQIWQTVKSNPNVVKDWYRDRWLLLKDGPKQVQYERIKRSYNDQANPADLLFLSRSCYGGVVRFRMRDGYMSTPCGVHDPIHPDSFARRVDDWCERVKGTSFFHREYAESFSRAQPGDLVYCDPPYTHTQAILYGAQRFSLADLFSEVEKAKSRGVFVAVSIDGSKKSSSDKLDIKWPERLFEREVDVNVGRSMLRRFQMQGQTLEKEVVKDRLLLTF